MARLSTPGLGAASARSLRPPTWRGYVEKGVAPNVGCALRFSWSMRVSVKPTSTPPVSANRPQVSMIDAILFDKLVSAYLLVSCHLVLSLTSQEFIARQVRDRDRPFGGIQVIVRQLDLHPPVERCSSSSSCVETSFSYLPCKKTTRASFSPLRQNHGLAVLGFRLPSIESSVRIIKVQNAAPNAHDTLMISCRVC